MSDYLQDDPRPTWDDLEREIQSLQQQLEANDKMCEELASGIQLGMEMINEFYIRDSNIRPVTVLNHFSTLLASYHKQRGE